MRSKPLFSLELFLLPQFRHPLSQTREQMTQMAAVMYGGVGLIGLFAIQFLPVNNETAQAQAQAICLFAMAFGLSCFACKRLPLWLLIAQIPFGISLVAATYWLLDIPGTTVIGAVYVLSSMYAFHFFHLYAVVLILLNAVIPYAWVSYEHQPDVWLSVTSLVLGLMLITGWLVRLLVDRIQQLAMHDRLTGLLNRYSMENLLEEAHTHDRDFLLVLIDLNDFKPINDQYGHLAGDRLLLKIAQILQKNLPSHVFVARWGGDEFLLYAPGLSIDGLNPLMQQLEQALLNDISFSWGYADSREFEHLQQMLAEADEQMYRDKAQKKSLLAVNSN